jgi:hypothetical protein
MVTSIVSCDILTIIAACQTNCTEAFNSDSHEILVFSLSSPQPLELYNRKLVAVSEP